MVKQKELALDFPGITHDNKILIVNLANIGENRVSTLGTLLLTELMLAGVKKPLESGHPFIIFADEFSFYHTPTLTQVLRLGRAYKMSLVLSHQNVEDLPQELAAGVFGNVAAMVAFRVGSTYAAKLSSNFGQEVEDNNFITIPLYKTYTKIETNIFTMDTLPPPAENMGQSALIIENSKKLCSGIPKPDDKKVEKGIPIGATLGFNEWYKVKWVAPLRDDPPDDLIKTG